MAGARYVVMLGCILLREGDVEEVATIALNAERRVTVRNIGIGEGVYELKSRVEHLDFSEAEIGGKEESAVSIAADSKSFVDRACTYSRAIDRENGVIQVDIRVPAGNRAIFGVKNEQSRTRLTIFRDNETTRAVEDGAGRRCRRSSRTTSRRRDRSEEHTSELQSLTN